MSTLTKVTADTLDRAVEFDHVFTVVDSSTITDGPVGVYAPELYWESDGHLIGDDWELVDGYSGQHGYRGPIMHASETLSGGMARAVLAEPGTYVVLACECAGCDDCDNGADSCEPAGWALARWLGEQA